MTLSRANAILQSRTRSPRAFEARLLSDAEYTSVRSCIQDIQATASSERTDAQRAELARLIDRKYEISDRLATA